MGTLAIDLVAEVDRLPRPGETLPSHGLLHEPGGTGIVQAIAAGRLEARVAVYGCVGLDAFGDQILALFGGAGIHMDSIERLSDVPTGASLVFVDPRRGRLAARAPGASGRLDNQYIERSLPRIQEADAVLLDLAIPAPAQCALLGGLPAPSPVIASHPTLVDPGLPWSRLDFLVGTRDEFLRHTRPSGGTPDDAARAGLVFVDRGVRNVVVVGADGVYLAEKGGVTRFPSHVSPLVNQDLAVDVFSSALAVRLAAGSGPYEAVGFASAAASLSAVEARSLAALPTTAEVLALLSRLSTRPSRPGG